MAELLKSMPRIKRPGRKNKYPYSEWLEMARKGPVKLTRGKDFNVEIKTMRHNLYRHSRTEGYEIETVTLGEEDDDNASIVIKTKPIVKKK